MITCNRSSFYTKDELLSRKKREKKKKTGSRSTDEAKLAALDKNERWEETLVFHVLKHLSANGLVLSFSPCIFEIFYEENNCICSNSHCDIKCANVGVFSGFDM